MHGQRYVLWLSNLLIAGGAVLLIGTFGLLGYSRYEQYEINRATSELAPTVPGAWTPSPQPTRVLAPFAEPTSAPPTDVPTSPVATSLSIPVTPTPIPTFTPLPILPAERIVANTINLDSKVVESPIVDGQWQVPKFVAGHLVGTAEPLQGSNVVLSGHVQSLSSGNVFSRIGELKPGDPIWLYTPTTMVSYAVSKVTVVPNNDLDVVKPTSSERVTLITCTGTWLPLQHDYNQRIVVIADRQG
jgi:LPXTG-site transpeptidase (sortase) family protein